MAIKLLNTKAFGQVVADVEETLTTGTVKAIKPALVQLQQHPETGKIGFAMMGVVTQFVKDSNEDYLFLKEDDVVGGHLEGHIPNDDLYNEYQNRFGSGFTLHTSPLIK